MKINFSILKLEYNITPKKFPSVSKQIINENINSKSLPQVSLPLVTYYIGEASDNALIRLIKKMKKTGVEIPSDYKPDPNTHSGLDIASKGKFRDAINKAAENGEISSSEQQDLLRNVAFTGKDDTDCNVYDSNNDDLDVDSEYTMAPELEAIYNAPPVDTPDGLVNTIFGDLPKDVDIDMDLWSSLKSMANDAFGDWL